MLLPIGICTMIALYLLLNHTQIGNVVRAATQDREMVGALGVNVPLLYTGVFAMGAFLGGLGGAVLAPMGALYPGMDFDVIIDVFLVVVLGGLGSIGGTALGALIFGELSSLGILFVPQSRIRLHLCPHGDGAVWQAAGPAGQAIETSR